MSENNSIPLHQRIHFRKLREEFVCIANYETINPQDYNLKKIKAYTCYGQDLKGNNVSYNTRNGRSPWVNDNYYEMFEAPALSNLDSGPYGDFLFLAHNVSFDFYIFGTMRVGLDVQASKSQGRPIEVVSFRVTGKYTFIYINGDANITKNEMGRDFDPGNPSSSVGNPFDSYNTRKLIYKTNNHKIMKSLGVNVNEYNTVDKDPVKIYKNRHKNNIQKKKNH